MTAPNFSVIQGAQSTTFSTPPLDGSLTIPELYAYHAEYSRTHKLFVYVDHDGIKTIDYGTVYRAQLAAAGLIKAAYEASADLYSDGAARPVFGILATTGKYSRAVIDIAHSLVTLDSVTFATVVLGIQQTGAVPFPISTRNSALAIAHLLSSTNTRQVFVSEDVALRVLALEAVTLLARDGYRAEVLDIPSFETLYIEAAPSTSNFCIAPFSQDATVLLLHSSGTSGFPKPIHLTNRIYISWGTCGCECFWFLSCTRSNSLYSCRTLDYGELDACGTRVGIQTAPMFHAMGALMLVLAVCSGIELAVFKPSRPPNTPNAEAFLDSIISTRSSWVLSVPSFIEVVADHFAFYLER